MTTPELVSGLSFLAVMETFYAVGLWLGWPERTYHQRKALARTWYERFLIKDSMEAEATQIRRYRFSSILAVILIPLFGILMVLAFLCSK